MKSKIEKIESVYDLYDGDRNIDANKLKDILNGIIDSLNSQSQPEEKPIYVACMGEEIVAGTDKSIEKHRKDIEDFLKGEDTPEEKTVEERMKEMETPYMETAKLEEWNNNERRKRDKLVMDMLDNAYKLHYVKDTPEEWEKEFKFLYGHLYIQNEDGEFCKVNGETEDMIDFIKQLLEERETKAFNEGVEEARESEQIQADWDTEALTRIVSKVAKKLSKLNNKKK